MCLNGTYNGNLGQESYQRKQKLDQYHQLRSEGCCQQTALSVLEVSRSTYYRWSKKHKVYGLEGLENEDRMPNNKRKPTWSSDVEQLVLQVRKRFPIWGKSKITTVILRDYGIKISESMVGRILSMLLKQDRIKSVAYCCGLKEFRKKRKFSGHAQPWEYGTKAKNPGELIQIDHATIQILNGIKIKHFKAVCPVTKYVVEQAYRSATSSIGEDFLRYMIEMFPFEIISMQVDGGSEFMGDFERCSEDLGIPLFVLPPRRPQYNGVVERGHRTVKYEFYYQLHNINTLSVLRGKLHKFTEFYNTFRPHMRLQNLTPMQYYNQLKQMET